MDAAAKYPRHADRRNKTFRQAEGIDPVPKMLARGEINNELRRAIWDALCVAFAQEHTDWGYTQLGGLVAAQILSRVYGYTIDDALKLGENPQDFEKTIKGYILKEDWYFCYEICQEAARASEGQGTFVDNIQRALDEPWSPYTLVDMNPWTFIPRSDETESKALRDDWAILKASPYEGAKTHLRDAAAALNAGQSRKAIAEAMHAVESAAKIVTGKDDASLGPALEALDKERGLHSALKNGFKSLYGYTSNEKGIRHALLDSDNANVGQDEALFMHSACTAFVAYLARKYPEKA